MIPMKVLGLCGSIKTNSSNFAILSAVKSFLPPGTGWDFFEIKGLPYFEPDRQFDNVPEIVKDLRLRAKNADLILISTPEYAHGIPGVLKNAVEWLLCEETMKKKVAVIFGSPGGGEYVKAHLLETIRTEDMMVDAGATLEITRAKTQISPEGKVLDEGLKRQLHEFVTRIIPSN